MNELFECSYSQPVEISAGSSTGVSFASSTCSVSSSTAIRAAGGFTYGEIVISVFLFLIFLTTAYQFIFNWTRGIKIGKKGV